MGYEVNLSSGGLALQSEDQLLLTDLASHSGSLLVNMQTPDRLTRLAGSLWFMNEGGQFVYGSDQLQENRLCRLDKESAELEVVLDRPVYGLIRQEDWLYYINEDDQRLYRCQLNGKHESRITDEQVLSFVMTDETIYYATAQMIRSCLLSGGKNERLKDTQAVNLLLVGEGQQLAYVDRDQKYVLTLLDLQTGETRLFEDISPVSMVAKGRYLYCANRHNNNSIYRVDLEQGSKIRICGERADYLHIVGDELYFMNNREWLRMSLTGGQAVRAIAQV